MEQAKETATAVNTGDRLDIVLACHSHAPGKNGLAVGLPNRDVFWQYRYVVMKYTSKNTVELTFFKEKKAGRRKIHMPQFPPTPQARFWVSFTPRRVEGYEKLFEPFGKGSFAKAPPIERVASVTRVVPGTSFKMEYFVHQTMYARDWKVETPEKEQENMNDPVIFVKPVSEQTVYTIDNLREALVKLNNMADTMNAKLIVKPDGSVGAEITTTL